MEQVRINRVSIAKIMLSAQFGLKFEPAREHFLRNRFLVCKVKTCCDACSPSDRCLQHDWDYGDLLKNSKTYSFKF